MAQSDLYDYRCDPGFLASDDFQQLLEAVAAAGYECLGPVAHDETIHYRRISHVRELPWGFRDDQAPGRYRLTRTDQPGCFRWANGPQALKPLTFRPAETLWRAVQNAGSLTFAPVDQEIQPTAVLGVRACDLAALRLQETHFLDGAVADHAFRARREALLLIGVDCSDPAATCFCASTGDGPAVSIGYDIRLAELDAGFLVWSGSARGAGLLDQLTLAPATAVQTRAARDRSNVAAMRQSRELPSRNLRRELFDQLDHRYWDEVAQRCLACGNCTAVCPTCFCSSYESRPSLDGAAADHLRLWDSCFSHGHSALHGRPVRTEICQRYRQWVTHKLAGWHDQFGRSGCVGCGRCVTWCPVGIDLTETAAAVVTLGDDA